MWLPVNTFIFWQQLMIFYHTRLADEPTGTIESVVFVVPQFSEMLRITLKWKFVIKRPLSQELSYIKH